MLFAVFLPLRGIDLLAARLAGRPVTALGPAMVRLWAAQALPTLGLQARAAAARRCAGGGAFVANHSSWIDIVALQRAAAPFLVSKAEVRAWPVIGLIGRAIGTMFIDRRPAEAKRQEAELFARLSRGDRMALFPEGTSTDGQRVLPFKSALFGVFFAPEMRRRRARSSRSASPIGRGPGCRRHSTAGGARWSSRATSARCWRARPAAWWS